jgi:hypothetical protein
MASQVSNQDWLSWLTKLMQTTATPSQKASRTLQEGFYCLLDEQSSHWYRSGFCDSRKRIWVRKDFVSIPIAASFPTVIRAFRLT